MNAETDLLHAQADLARKQEANLQEQKQNGAISSAQINDAMERLSRKQTDLPVYYDEMVTLAKQLKPGSVSADEYVESLYQLAKVKKQPNTTSPETLQPQNH